MQIEDWASEPCCMKWINKPICLKGPSIFTLLLNQASIELPKKKKKDNILKLWQEKPINDIWRMFGFCLSVSSFSLMIVGSKSVNLIPMDCQYREHIQSREDKAKQVSTWSSSWETYQKITLDSIRTEVVDVPISHLLWMDKLVKGDEQNAGQGPSKTL